MLKLLRSLTIYWVGSVELTERDKANLSRQVLVLHVIKCGKVTMCNDNKEKCDKVLLIKTHGKSNCLCAAQTKHTQTSQNAEKWMKMLKTDKCHCTHKKLMTDIQKSLCISFKARAPSWMFHIAASVVYRTHHTMLVLRESTKCLAMRKWQVLAGPPARQVWHWEFNLHDIGTGCTRGSPRVATIYFGSGQCT